MVPVGHGRGTDARVRSTFGKSTYIELYLSRSSIHGLILVKDDMPSIWRLVESNTIAVMERAVIMHAA